MMLAFALALVASVVAYDEVMPYRRWKRTFVKNTEHEPHPGLTADRADSKWDIRAHRKIYNKNLKLIKAHNRKHDVGLVSFRMGVNEYTDLTHEQFLKAIGHGGCTFKRTRPLNLAAATDLPTDIADTVDWRDKKVVTPVKNQQDCGSCWSFSATGALEGAYAIATGTLKSFSEQQLIDCSTSYGDHGCKGGLMDYAFQYIEDNGGDDIEGDYQYIAKEGICDKSKEKKHEGDIMKYTDVEPSNVEALKTALNVGPVSVSVQANSFAFQFYRSGVFAIKNCGTTPDHGVLAVGYTDDAWIVKNSWGPGWGDEGYIYMAMNTSNKEGECGILLTGSYPTSHKSKETGNL